MPEDVQPDRRRLLQELVFLREMELIESIPEVTIDPDWEQKIIQEAIDNPLSDAERRRLYYRVLGILHPDWTAARLSDETRELIANMKEK